MERKMLIRNISYMERELSEMKKELATLDARWEQQEKNDHRRIEDEIMMSKSH
ncbi:hypothetical protein MD588_21045 [Photobacterium sp. SDRW27]|uniref:hypothetical protein n=1 Tax=Photobacterium obscurum TaxID=2829490 RepID=UPI002244ED7D|nr:hypothetical protein [Photobacterium obscurum]MCW8331284.1 hypothetical protein [Photobacterium obscurum]